MKNDNCEHYVELPALPVNEHLADCNSNGHYLCEYCAYRKRCFCGEPTGFLSHRCEKCDEVIFKIFD
jgi:hypothetical protein